MTAPESAVPAPLHPRVRNLVRGSAFAILSAVTASGGPGSWVMWVDADDDHPLINTSLGQAKTRALDAHPLVSVLLLDMSSPYRYAEIRGDVVDKTVGPRASEHSLALAHRYTGQASSVTADPRVL